MRKKVMSTSKRKWIVSGLLGFGAVALLTTGFATWVVGVNKSNTTIDPSTKVDGTVNKMISLTVEFQSGDDSEVSVTENKTGEFISNSDGKATDFVVKPHIKIEIGKSLDQLPKGIEFSLGYKELMDTTIKTDNADGHPKTDIDNNKVNVTSNTKTHKTGNYEYFKISDKANITLPLLSSTDDWNVASVEGGFNTYTGKGTKNDGWKVTETASSYTYTSNNAIEMFAWGSFFDNVSPVQFYDGLYKTGKDGLKLENTADDIDFVVNEMTTMEKLFNGKSLKVVCSLTLQSSK